MSVTPIYKADHPAVVASLEAMALGRKSWEALRDECRAWARVKAAIDPNALSNTGARNIHWYPGRTKNAKPFFYVQLDGAWGSERFTMAAPALTEVRGSDLLKRAVERRDRVRAELTAKHGSHRHSRNRGKDGSHAHYNAILSATKEGRQYIEDRHNVAGVIGTKAATAEAYDPDGWSRKTSIYAHRVLRAHPDRLGLVAVGIVTLRAQALVKELNAPTAKELPYISARRQAAKSSLPDYLEAELHRAYDEGITLDQIVEYWSSKVDTMGSERVRVQAA